MTLTAQHMLALLPLLIVGLTVVVVMLSIAWRRDHFLNATIAVIGLNVALFSLFIVGQQPAMDVTPLLKVDGFSVFFIALVLLASLATCTFAYPWLAGYPDNKEEFYLLVLIAALGGVVLACANHLAALFIGIELLSLPLFGLVGYAYRQRRSLEAAVKYMVLSAAASSFLLFGMALLYAGSGGLSFAALGNSMSDGALHQPILVLGLGMMLVGFGFKLSLVPFQLWTPDVYQGAPAPVSTFLATASKIAIFGALVRMFMYAPVADSESVRLVLGIIAFCSILFGNILAISQSNIKRMLGYSSIAHLGYLLVALIAVQGNQLSVETVNVYLAGYLFASLGAFGVVSLMSSPYTGPDAESLHAYRGLFWHKPILSAVLTVMMLSLAGVPMTLGFIGKFYVIAIGVSAELWWLTLTVVVGSAIGLYYYLRVMVSLYLEAPQELKRDTPSNWALTAGGVVVLLSALAVLFFGLYPEPLVQLAKYAFPMAL